MMHFQKYTFTKIKNYQEILVKMGLEKTSLAPHTATTKAVA